MNYISGNYRYVQVGSIDDINIYKLFSLLAFQHSWTKYGGGNRTKVHSKLDLKKVLNLIW